MHGRVKSSTAVSAAEQEATKRKAATYSELSRVLLERRKARDVSAETNELVGKMLRSNPDFYTLWNYRKEILLSNCAAANVPLKEVLAGGQGRVPLSGGVGESLLEAELSLTADCIKKNPKSYGAWYHRKWLTTHFEFNVERELELCELLLSADQRNFHCWNYRRHVVSLAALSPEHEGEFSTKKLNENFSNYSAFHHRSVFLPRLAQSETAFQHLIATELSLVENAIYTEPDDQSAWWYQQFLFGWISRGRAQDGVVHDRPWALETLRQQLGVVEGLLEVEEEGCRWALESIVLTLSVLLSLSSGEGAGAGAGKEEEEWRARREEALKRLLVLDPAHEQRYRHHLEEFKGLESKE